MKILPCPWKALKIWNYYNKSLIEFCQKNSDDYVLIQVKDLLAKQDKLYRVLTEKWKLPFSPLRVKDILEKNF